MSPTEAMQRIDTLLSHIWMVRTFIKHSEEAEDDDELAEIHRELYDYMLALGAPWQAGDAAAYLKLARKKFSKLRRVTDKYRELQPEVSTHMNFQMSVRSLDAAVREIETVLKTVEGLESEGQNTAG
jgi:cob(I)alamin adenosyltransferase